MLPALRYRGPLYCAPDVNGTGAYFSDDATSGTDHTSLDRATGTISWLRSLPFERGTVFPSEFLRR